VNLIDVEHEMARLDAGYRPIATTPLDRSDPDAIMNLGSRIEAALAELGVEEQAEAVLRAVIDVYDAGDETARVADRHLFDRYTSFRWAAHLPRE
jgi:hypothetical protein